MFWPPAINPLNHIPATQNHLLEWMVRKLHDMYSFVIQRITCRNRFGFFLGEFRMGQRKGATSEKNTQKRQKVSRQVPTYSTIFAQDIKSKSSKDTVRQLLSGTNFPFPVGGLWRIRSEKLQNKSSPIFSYFRPEFRPEFCFEFSLSFWGVFVHRLVGNGDQKKITKIPAIFQCEIPRQTRRKNPQKFSGEHHRPLNGPFYRGRFPPWRGCPKTAH